MLIHHFLKHAVFNSEKEHKGILTGEIILMDTVFVDEADIALMKYDILSGNILPEVTFYNISKLNIVMGMALCFSSAFEGKAAAEAVRRRIHGSAKLISAAEIPAQKEDPLGRKQGICLDFLCRFGIFDRKQSGSQRMTGL